MMSKRPTVRRLGAAVTALGVATVNVAVLVAGWTHGWITWWWVVLIGLSLWLAVEAVPALLQPDDPRPFKARNAVGSRRWWTRGTEQYDLLAWSFTAVTCLLTAVAVAWSTLSGWRALMAPLLIVTLLTWGVVAAGCVGVLGWRVRQERRRVWAGLPPEPSVSSRDDDPVTVPPSPFRGARGRRGASSSLGWGAAGRAAAGRAASGGETAGREASGGETAGREAAPVRAAASGLASTSFGADATPVSPPLVPPGSPAPFTPGRGGPSMDDTVEVTPLLRPRSSASRRPSPEVTEALAQVAADANPSPAMETLHHAFPPVTGVQSLPLPTTESMPVARGWAASAGDEVTVHLEGVGHHQDRARHVRNAPVRGGQRPPTRREGPVVDLSSSRRGRRP